VFGKHPFGLFWIVLLQEKKYVFATQSLKNKNNKIIFLHMDKNSKII
jgi:hypothetical protein